MSRRDLAKTGLKLSGYGTAMAAAAGAQYAEASIVALNFVSNTVAWQGTYNQQKTKALMKGRDGAATVISFWGSNYFSSSGLYKTFHAQGRPMVAVAKPVAFKAVAANAVVSGTAGFTVAGASYDGTLFGLKWNAGGSDSHYGWMRVNWGVRGGPITILEAYYNNSVNGTINAGDRGTSGAVPEPSSLPVFAGLASLALGATRRNKPAAA